MDPVPLQPIGTIRSPFKQKFGIPRQPGLVAEAPAVIELSPPYASEESIRGLSDFSHLWVLFLFHRNLDRAWKPTVRPPRLGGNERIGVFASRSGFRPNPIGMSVVRLERIEKKGDRIRLHTRGGDFLDRTPVIDIKPYIAYADAVPGAECGYAGRAPEKALDVTFSPEAGEILAALENRRGFPFLSFVRNLLAYDPRPAYRRSGPDRGAFGVRIFDFDIRGTVENGRVLVRSVHLDEQGPSGG